MILKHLKVIIATVLLLVGFSAFSATAEAAKNPISPKQSRVTYTIKDANGVPYKVYFAGVQEKKAIASDDSTYDWAGLGFNTFEGDQLYHGNYRLYTHKVGTSHIKTTKAYFPQYTLNMTTKSVHMYPSRYKGQPDLLAVSENLAEINDDGYFDEDESTDLYYIKNGVLTFIVSIAHDRRFMNTGKNRFLFTNNLPGYRNIFYEFYIDPKTNRFEPYEDIRFNNPGAVLRNWKKHWQ